MSGNLPGIDRDPASIRRRIEVMEGLLERMFVIPGINRPVGLDVILDMIPVIGPSIAARSRPRKSIDRGWPIHAGLLHQHGF